MIIVATVLTPIQIAKTIICLPIESFWDKTVPNPRCIDQQLLFMCDTAVAMTIDVVILFLPIPLTWSLPVSFARNMQISALLSAGGVAVIITAIRLIKVNEFKDSKDITADFVVLDILT